MMNVIASIPPVGQPAPLGNPIANEQGTAGFDGLIARLFQELAGVSSSDGNKSPALLPIALPTAMLVGAGEGSVDGLSPSTDENAESRGESPIAGEEPSRIEDSGIDALMALLSALSTYFQPAAATTEEPMDKNVGGEQADGTDSGLNVVPLTEQVEAVVAMARNETSFKESVKATAAVDIVSGRDGELFSALGPPAALPHYSVESQVVPKPTVSTYTREPGQPGLPEGKIASEARPHPHSAGEDVDQQGPTTDGLPKPASGVAGPISTGTLLPLNKPDQEPAIALRSVADQIARRAHLITTRGKTGLRIQLEPRELGKIWVQVAVGANGVSVTLAAETSDARDLIQDSLQQLRTAFQEQGLSLDRFAVESGLGFLGTGILDDGRGRQQSTGQFSIVPPRRGHETAQEEDPQPKTMPSDSLVDYRV